MMELLKDVPIEMIYRILSYFNENISDALAIGCCSRFFNIAISQLPFCISLEGRRLNDTKWKQLFYSLHKRFSLDCSLTFSHCNVTPECLMFYFLEYATKDKEIANNSPKSSDLVPRNSSLITLRALALTKCFLVMPRGLEDLPWLNSLESFCLGSLSRCSLQASFNPMLRVLGLSNYQITDYSVNESFAFLNDLANILMGVDVVPNLEYLFLGGLKGYASRSMLGELAQEYDLAGFEPTATFPAKLKLIELTFWKEAAISDFKFFLRATCWGKDNGPQLPQIVNFENDCAEALGEILPCGLWLDADTSCVVGTVLRAALDCANVAQRRPSHLAAMQGDTEKIHWLIRHHTSKNIRDGKGCTPFLRAVEAGHLEIATKLKDAGADLWIKNHNNEGAVYLAALKGHDKVLSMLLHQLQTDQILLQSSLHLHDGDGFSPLHAACLRQSVNTARLLVEAGFQVDTRNKYKQTALHLAARNGQIEMIEFLLDLNANIDAKDEVQCTPIQVAELNANHEAVQVLLSRGAKFLGERSGKVKKSMNYFKSKTQKR